SLIHLDQNGNNDDTAADLAQLEKRLERHLPKYGSLWRSMAGARMTKEMGAKWDSADGISGISAVDHSELKLSANSQKLIGSMPEGDKENAMPWVWQQQSAVVGINMIDNQDIAEKRASGDEDDENHRTLITNEGRGGESNLRTATDDSIVIVSRVPKMKRFVVESDDEDQGDIVSAADDVSIDEEEENMGNNSDSVPNTNSLKFDDIDFSSDEDSKQRNSFYNSSERSHHQLKSLQPKASGSEFIGSDDSESEKEWIELLSSDEEVEALQPPKRINRVVILSDDEEESESENDNDDDHSAFTISDDSNSSEESEDSTFRKSSGRRLPNKNLSGGQVPPRSISREQHVKGINKQPKSSSNYDARATLAFRKNRDTLTLHTFSEFNRQAFQGLLLNVKVIWSKKLNKTAGITRMRGKLGESNAHTRVATIELSTKVIDDEERLRSTLLHEMCHAAQWLVDGTHKPPHGTIFKKWAAISMRKIRDVKVTTTHDYQIAYKYAWACTASNCKAVIKRHSRSVDPDKHCCGRCQGKLIEIEVPRSRADNTEGVSHALKVARKTSVFALFVKEQTTDVRKRLAKEKSCKPKEISQALVMKECGRLWRIRKESLKVESSEPDCLESLAERLVENCSIK
ncbi:hypothetical protein ACHAXA_004385, partial [Cyclostephanos tholiformis]